MQGEKGEDTEENGGQESLPVSIFTASKAEEL